MKITEEEIILLKKQLELAQRENLQLAQRADQAEKQLHSRTKMLEKKTSKIEKLEKTIKRKDDKIKVKTEALQAKTEALAKTSEELQILKKAIGNLEVRSRYQLFLNFAKKSEKYRTLFHLSKKDVFKASLEGQKQQKKEDAIASKLQEKEDIAAAQNETIEGEALGSQENQGIEEDKDTNPNKRNKHPLTGKTTASKGKHRIDPSYPKTIVENELTDTTCPNCGAMLKDIGLDEIYEYLDLSNEMLQVIQERRHKYICPVCGFTQESVVVDDKGNSLDATKKREEWKKEQTGYIKAPPLLNRFIQGGLIGNHLLASSLCDKYVSGLSCYRQSYRYQNFGVDISRQNLSSWFLKIGTYFIPIAEEIRKEIIKFEACLCDETRFKVMEEKEHDDNNQSWVWVLSSPNPEKRAVYYRYDPFRSSEVLEQIIGDYSGYFMSDKHSAYKTQRKKYHFTSCFCLAHARREFAKLIESHSYSEGTEGYTTIKFAIETMGRVFAADTRNRSRYMDISKPDIPGFLKHRRAEVEPALKELTNYLIERLEVHENDDNLTSAINYYLNDVKKFSSYLGSPWLDCSNNKSERLVKKLFPVRINSLFAGSPKGARALAAIETVLQTAMLNGINVENYATYLLDELTILNYDKDKQLDYSKYLPWNFNDEVTSHLKTNMITEVNMHVSHRKKRKR